jgi:hypothetical protein
MSLSQYISNLFEFALSVKSEAEELLGFNRFRKANVNASDAVSNVNAGTYAGSLITELLFNQFNHYVERECTGLLDLSSHAYKDGVHKQYLRTDGELAVLSLHPESIRESDFGVFVKNGGKIKNDFEILKQRTLEFAQNGMKPEMVAKILSSSSNYSSIIEEIKEDTASTQKAQQAQQQAEQQARQQEIDLRAKEMADQLKLAYYKIESDNQTKLEIAFGTLYDGMVARGQQDDTVELLKLKQEFMVNKEANYLKHLDTVISYKAKLEEIASKERISKDQLAIAKVNKN